MRTRLLTLIAIVAVAFASCQKETHQLPATQPNPLLGTWSILKINSTTLNAGGQQVNATTYTQPLSAANQVVFGKDSIAIWTTDHFYQYGELGDGVMPQRDFKSGSYSYSIQGKTIIMNQFFGIQGPMGPQDVWETDTATLVSADLLVIHSTYAIKDGSKVMADTYYTK